uniref:DUF488 domain-containing protein n=1 Tax=Salinibacterium sp. TMP30 TaxID=3138237 RepID=UPI0040548AC1
MQGALAQAEVAYEHHLELAPTTELRHLQYTEDDRQRAGKRSRIELTAEYTRRYSAEILDYADLLPLMAAQSGSGTAALLYVERDPEACHRSLISQRMLEQHRVTSVASGASCFASLCRSPIGVAPGVRWLHYSSFRPKRNTIYRVPLLRKWSQDRLLRPTAHRLL